jgi:hypothetical protein
MTLATKEETGKKWEKLEVLGALAPSSVGAGRYDSNIE